jgi:hypothetical protein
MAADMGKTAVMREEAKAEDDVRLRTLQLFYAALMVDSAINFERLGATEKVAGWKAPEQAAAAVAQLAQLGVSDAASLFGRFSELFGCARWEMARDVTGTVEATTTTCLACAIAKRRGAGRPCDLYCINPFRGLAAALSPAHGLEVEETLWEGRRCRFRVAPRA